MQMHDRALQRVKLFIDGEWNSTEYSGIVLNENGWDNYEINYKDEAEAEAFVEETIDIYLWGSFPINGTYTKSGNMIELWNNYHGTGAFIR